MTYVYTSTEDGQTIETDATRPDLDVLARWVRTETSEPTPTPSTDGTTPAPAGEPAPSEPTPTDRPRGNASRDEWVAYALTHGCVEADIENLSRDQIAEKFPANA